jgi:hypothetical protein
MLSNRFNLLTTHSLFFGARAPAGGTSKLKEWSITSRHHVSDLKNAEMSSSSSLITHHNNKQRVPFAGFTICHTTMAHDSNEPLKFENSPPAC